MASCDISCQSFSPDREMLSVIQYEGMIQIIRKVSYLYFLKVKLRPDIKRDFVYRILVPESFLTRLSKARFRKDSSSHSHELRELSDIFLWSSHSDREEVRTIWGMHRGIGGPLMYSVNMMLSSARKWTFVKSCA